MSNLKTLILAVIEDGKVDDDEVVQIRENVYADTVIDTEEATGLFEINNAVSGNPDNSPLWDDLFVEAITDFVLQDDVSPGVVDSDEAQFLIEQIGLDGQVDAVETRLLANIQAEATSIDQTLVEFINSQS